MIDKGNETSEIETAKSLFPPNLSLKEQFERYGNYHTGTMGDAFIAAVRKALHPELEEEYAGLEASNGQGQAVQPNNNNARLTTATGVSRATKPSQQSGRQSYATASSYTASEPPAAVQSRKRGNTDPATLSSCADLGDDDPPSLGKAVSSSTADVTTGTKRRKTKAVSASTARGARYRPHPSRAVLDRHTRSSRHRLFLIEREARRNGDGGDDGNVRFAVMGANGNVYKCSIGLKPTCTCPDFTKRVDGPGHGPCKHLIFIFMRVFKVDKEDPVWWQTRLLPEEVETLLEKAPGVVGADVMVNEGVRREYQAIKPSLLGNDGSGKESTDVSSDRRKKIEGDCPICFEDLTDGDSTRPDDVITFCEKCGNNLHKTCVQNWARAKGKATCPLCRADMSKDEAITQRPAEYTNLASYSSSHARQMTLAELYADTHQYIGRRRPA